jgi:hypothetical protein
MAETPWAHFEVAVATNWTVVETLLLLTGAETETPATADVAVAIATQSIKPFIRMYLSSQQLVAAQTESGAIVGMCFE